MNWTFNDPYCEACLQATRDQLDDAFLRDQGVTATDVRLEGRGEKCEVIVEWRDHAGGPRQSRYKLSDYASPDKGPPEDPNTVALFISTDLMQQ